MVNLGSYYMNESSLVKVILRATNGENSIIVFSKVGKGGCASDPVYMYEADFVNSYKEC